MGIGRRIQGMAEVGGEVLVAAVALTALILLPLASWLIAGVGAAISAELDGDRRPLSARLGAGHDLVAEARSMAVAANERRRRAGKPPLDLDEEVERRLREAGAGT